MYNVSQAYKTALSKPAKMRWLTGYIGNVPFSDENIAHGSFVLENRCADGNDITLGYSYMGNLSCVFKGINLAGNWKGKVITPTEALLVGENTWESVPLGVYTVSEAVRREDGMYIMAYDNMHKLDKDFSISTTSGTMYDMLSLMAEKCSVELAQTEQEIRALPNGTRAFVLYSENSIKTWRDFLFWIAQTMCCFATCTRDGKIILRKYGGTSVDSVGKNIRWQGAGFSDFTTHYTGVSVTQIEKQTTDYLGAEVDDGLTYNLGENPFLQGISTTNILAEILTELRTIEYTPFTVSRAGCPAYDLGDAITFPEGLGAGAVGCLMMYSYTYHGEYKMAGYGSDPALSTARNKVDKDVAGLMSRVNANEVQFYTTTNAKELSINQNYKEIIKIRFSSSRATIVTFQAEIKCDAEITEQDVDKIVSELQYVFNGETLDYKPVETWIEGTHLLHLLYYFPVQGAAINTLSVRMKTDGAISIGRADIQAAVSGQGLVATSTWDGYIELEDEVTSITFRTTPSEASNVSDTLTLVTHDPIDISVVSDNVVSFSFRTTPSKIADAEGEVYANKRRLADYTWEQVANTVIGAWDAYREDVTYYGGDLVYIETNGTRTEYRCTCGDGESTSGPFDAACWEVRTYNTWGDIYRLCAW